MTALGIGLGVFHYRILSETTHLRATLQKENTKREVFLVARVPVNEQTFRNLQRKLVIVNSFCIYRKC